jgi:hypothetical protein
MVHSGAESQWRRLRFKLGNEALISGDSHAYLFES